MGVIYQEHRRPGTIKDDHRRTSHQLPQMENCRFHSHYAHPCGHCYGYSPCQCSFTSPNTQDLANFLAPQPWLSFPTTSPGMPTPPSTARIPPAQLSADFALDPSLATLATLDTLDTLDASLALDPSPAAPVPQQDQARPPTHDRRIESLEQHIEQLNASVKALQQTLSSQETWIAKITTAQREFKDVLGDALQLVDSRNYPTEDLNHSEPAEQHCWSPGPLQCSPSPPGCRPPIS